MDLSSKPVRNPDTLSRRIIDDEMVLVNGDTSVSLALTNRTTVAVWEMLDRTRTVSEIITAIKEQFQDVPDNVADDILSLLESLSQDGFIGFEME